MGLFQIWLLSHTIKNKKQKTRRNQNIGNNMNR
uniref:Uncharacterized protein n=1 Tax=Tetranychus urticae TaxID=32264 RepID=T1KK44_TETUR